MKFNFNPVEPIRVTSPFGPRKTGLIGATKNHMGVDLGINRALAKTPVILTNKAKLVKNSWDDYRGWYVVFDIDGAYSVLYQHLAERCALEMGSVYEPGTQIGFIGASRDIKKVPVMAAHLHFEVHLHGIPINPALFLNNLEEYEMEKTYKTLNDIPSWGKAAMEKVLAKGGIIPVANTTATINDDTIDITHSMLRIYVSLDRMGKL